MPGWHRVKWYGVLAIGSTGTAAAAFILSFNSDEAFGWVAFFFCLFMAAMAVHELWPRLIEGPHVDPTMVLQLFPGPAILRSLWRKLVFFLISTIIFGGCLLWMALHSDMSAFAKFFVWLGAIGCAAGVPIFILAIWRRSRLELDADGFTVFQGLKRSTHRWSDTSEFSIVDVGILMVVFDDATLMHGTVAQLNRSLIGYSGALPDTYGMAAGSLAWLLNEWRARALAIPPPASQSSPAP